MLRRPDRALARCTRALLLSDLARRTAYLAARLRHRRARAAVRQRRHERLVHDGAVRLDAKDKVVHIDAVDFLACAVVNREFHRSFFFVACDFARRTVTVAFVAPGTAPAIISKPFASSFAITRRFFDVTCTEPMCPAIFWPLYTRPGVVPEPI